MATITKELSSYNMRTDGVMGSLFLEGYKLPRFSEIIWDVFWNNTSNPALAYKYAVTIGSHDRIVRKIKLTTFVNYIKSYAPIVGAVPVGLSTL